MAFQRGEFTPYTTEELIDLIADIKPSIPVYCRVNRIIRDIPKDHIVAGSTASNLREVIKRKLLAEGRACRCIRCREVRGESARVRVPNVVGAEPSGPPRRPIMRA